MTNQSFTKWIFFLIVLIPINQGLAQNAKLEAARASFLDLRHTYDADPQNIEAFKNLSAQGQELSLELSNALKSGTLDNYQYTTSLIETYTVLAEGFANFGNREMAMELSDTALAYARDTTWELRVLISRYLVYLALDQRDDALNSLMAMADSQYLGTDEFPEASLGNVLFLAETLVDEDRKPEAIHYYERFFEQATKARKFGHTQIMPFWQRYKALAKELDIKVKRKDFLEKEVRAHDKDRQKYRHRGEAQQEARREARQHRIEQEGVIFEENRKAFALNRKNQNGSRKGE